MKLSGNTVLITGGATGIGLAMAEAFLRAGSEVIICGRKEEKLLKAKKMHSGLHIKTCDVTDLVDCKALVQWIAASFQRFNVLVNNAGVQRDIDFTGGVDAYLNGESEIKVNLEAPIILSALFIPLLIGKSEAAIINVSSGLAFVPAARMPVYSATKAGMHAFSMGLRQQLSKLGIKVFEIVPPAVDTDLNPEGRAQQGNFKPSLRAEQFVAALMPRLEGDVFEIGYGMTAEMLSASRSDLDKRFREMNSKYTGRR